MINTDLKPMYNLTYFTEVLESTTATSLLYLLAAQGDKDARKYIDDMHEAKKARDFQEQYSSKGTDEAKEINRKEREKHNAIIKKLGTPGEFFLKQKQLWNMSDDSNVIPNPLDEGWTRVYYFLKFVAARERLHNRYGSQEPMTWESISQWYFPHGWQHNPYVKLLMKYSEDHETECPNDGFVPNHWVTVKVNPWISYHRTLESDEAVEVDPILSISQMQSGVTFDSLQEYLKIEFDEKNNYTEWVIAQMKFELSKLDKEYNDYFYALDQINGRIPDELI